MLAVQYEGDKAASDKFIDQYTQWDENLHGAIAANIRAQQQYRFRLVQIRGAGRIVTYFAAWICLLRYVEINLQPRLRRADPVGCRFRAVEINYSRGAKHRPNLCHHDCHGVAILKIQLLVVVVIIDQIRSDVPRSRT